MIRRKAQIKFKNILCSALGVVSLWSCQDQNETPLMSLRSDALEVAAGVEANILLKWGDPLSNGRLFGFGNSGLLALNQGETSSLMVLHGELDPVIISNYEPRKLYQVRKRDAILTEANNTGIEVLPLTKPMFGSWEIDEKKTDFPYITIESSIDFASNQKVDRKAYGKGTVNGVAPISTPWGSYLIPEGDYIPFFGERIYNQDSLIRSTLEWGKLLRNSPLEFGWVLEWDLESDYLFKHLALGRMAHSPLAFATSEKGLPVVYYAEERAGGALYKFECESDEKLSPGKLFVADFENAKWQPILFDSLSDHFTDEIHMLSYLPHAAKMVGATSLSKPAGLVVDLVKNELYVAEKGDSLKPAGGIFKIDLNQSELKKTYVDSKLTNPFRLALDHKGQMWISNDQPFDGQSANNGLYVVNDLQKFEAIQLLSGPFGSSFHAPTFLEETAFICLDHPGRGSSADTIISHWPNGSELPKSAIIQLQGELIEELLGSE